MVTTFLRVEHVYLVPAAEFLRVLSLFSQLLLYNILCRRILMEKFLLGIQLQMKYIMAKK